MHMVNNKLKIVKNEIKYWNFILKLRNENRKWFKETKIISTKEHYSFMNKHHKGYKICLLNNIPIGFIGYVTGDIRICVDKKYQNKKIGSYMLKKTLKNKKYKTLIKINNFASLKLFEKHGFKPKYIILEN